MCVVVCYSPAEINVEMRVGISICGKMPLSNMRNVCGVQLFLHVDQNTLSCKNIINTFSIVFFYLSRKHFCFFLVSDLRAERMKIMPIFSSIDLVESNIKIIIK